MFRRISIWRRSMFGFASSVSLLVSICLGCEAQVESLWVQSQAGLIRGIDWDEGTEAWLGIAYAEPPVGDLRFRAPRALPDTDQPQLATTFGRECVQYGGLLLDLDPETFGQPMGEEDCLYLNVWRKRDDAFHPSATKRPVFVYLHGGFNVVGEAATSLYHGAELAKNTGLVVVTLNYRLGPFGWFAHAALENLATTALDRASNFALLDILAALTWVKQNIAAFGGDPGNVILAGESGGAFNVISLMGSPLAAGLFHKAIAMSPLTSFMVSTKQQADQKSEEVLAHLMVQDGTAGSKWEAKRLLKQKSDDWIASYVRSKSAEEILSSSTKLSEYGFNEIGVTTQAFGGSRIADDTVIPIDFQSRFESGDYNQVPLIIGSNSEEFKIFELAFGVLSKPDSRELSEIVQAFDPNQSDLMLDDFMPPCHKPLYDTIGADLGEAVFRQQGVDPVADTLCRYQPVFVYQFAWHAQPEPFDFLVGASHMMAIPFLFGNFQTDSQSVFRFAWSDQNRAHRERLSYAIQNYVSQFAQEGDPNRETSDLALWHRWSLDSPVRLILE